MNIKRLHTIEAFFQRRKIEKPAKGFFTRAEFCKLWDICEQHGNRKLKKYLDAGLIETRNYRVKTGSLIRVTPHYRIK